MRDRDIINKVNQIPEDLEEQLINLNDNKITTEDYKGEPILIDPVEAVAGFLGSCITYEFTAPLSSGNIRYTFRLDKFGSYLVNIVAKDGNIENWEHLAMTTYSVHHPNGAGAAFRLDAGTHTVGNGPTTIDLGSPNAEGNCILDIRGCNTGSNLSIVISITRLSAY